AAVRAPAGALTLEEVRARDPKFYTWYTQLPVRPISALVDAGCHRKGDPAAKVAIVEFSDFQCPYCVQAFRDLRDLVRSRPEVSLVFRHYPLDATCNTQVKRTMHPDACRAACAAECAGRQGRFWEFHDVLFENNEHLERDDLFRYAREMGLDLAAFRACLDDPSTRARVGDDVAAATRAGVTSTPTIFFNGRTIEGALDRAYYDYALIIERHTGHAHGAEAPS
ncbi:MAG TPA: DsbA family protein, partial [Candidatus Binatia bacterium]|nr:DsbA family protein [Candidatus Binatia bacterium]